MITKGASQIRGVRSLNTRPGPVTESSALLRLYLLAVEKDNLMKRVAWVQQQRDQAEKRLAEIALAMHTVKRTVDERAKRESSPHSFARSRTASIKY